MNVLQTWVVIGLPGLVIAAGLFVGRSRARAWLGYTVLAVLVLLFVVTPGGGVSAALVGAVAVALLATGRGTRADDAVGEHHESRRRFTTAVR